MGIDRVYTAPVTRGNGKRTKRRVGCEDQRSGAANGECSHPRRRGERVSSLVGFSFEGKRSSWVTLPRFCSELQWLKVKSSGEEELNPHTISLRMLASFQPGNHKAHRMNCHATNNERLVCRASLN